MTGTTFPHQSRVGFVFPVSIGSPPPLLVSAFAEKINLDAAEEIFALVTMGGSCGDGGAWKHLNRILKNVPTGWMQHIA